MPRQKRSVLFDPSVVWFVEARQLTGQYEPIAAPALRPYTRAAAILVMEAIAEAMPAVRDRLRLWPYRALEPDEFDARRAIGPRGRRRKPSLLHPRRPSSA